MELIFEEPSSPKIVPKNKDHLNDLVGNSISLKLLQFLESKMQPHHLHFNVVDIAAMLEEFVNQELEVPETNPERALSQLVLTALPFLSLGLNRKLSDNEGNIFQLRREQTLQALLDQMRVVFVYWGRTTLSYEYINQFIYNQQLKILNSPSIDQDYMETGEKRIRIDQNLKLCIMPLSYACEDEQHSRIRDALFQENMIGSELEAVYAVSRDNVRAVHIKPELIGIAGDYDRKGSKPNSCWYKFEEECIRPKRQTLSFKLWREKEAEQQSSMTLAEAKKIKTQKATNLSQMISSTRLQVLKAEASTSVVAIITMDQSFIVQPLKNNTFQGYIGNLYRDIPPVVAYNQSKQIYQEILLLHGYNDNSWLILTPQFIYLYSVPAPSQNIVLRSQNNTSKGDKYKKNPLLLLCQRLPSGCIKAQVLGQKHVALMLQSNSIVVIELIVHNRGILEGKNLRPEDNYYKITNKIYNDIQFKAICYNPKEKYLFLSDFGAYLVRLTFSPTHGDIEEEGPTHDKQENIELNKQMIKNSYTQLHASRSKYEVKNAAIREMDEEDEEEDSYIQVHYLKGYKDKQNKHLLSLYKKQTKSPHTIIIKNQTRQVITLITASPHYNTLVTYESQTFEKKSMGNFEGDLYREWGNKNTIKLWDARHMTIYQTLKVPIQAGLLSLRANGLYFLTAEKGYLGCYQFNEDKKAMISKGEQMLLDKQNMETIHQLGDEVIFENGTLYFTSIVTTYNKFNTVRTHRTHLSCFNLQHYPDSSHLQILPSEVTSMAVRSRIYMLENSRQGVEACQLHIYNRVGLKEEMLVYSNREDIDVATGKVRHQNYNQEFKFIKKVNHNQFEVVLWNSDCFKLIGISSEESLTVVFHSKSAVGKPNEGQVKNQIKNIEVSNNKLIIYYEHVIKTREPIRKDDTTETGGSQKKRTSKYREESYNNIAFFNCDNDRLVYKLDRISNKITILNAFNSILLIKEEDPNNPNYDLIRVLDIMEPGSLINKYIFSAKIAKQNTQTISLKQLQKENIMELDDSKNQILKGVKQFTVRKNIHLEESKITVSQSNQLMLILTLKIETQILPSIGKQPLRVTVQFMVYSRNITMELVNRDYKVSRLQIGVKTKKNIKEYQAIMFRTQNISENKEITFESLVSSSNFGQINMEHLCELILEQGSSIPTPDLTPHITNPSLIGIDRAKAIYRIVDLKQEPIFNKLFGEKLNRMNILTASTFRVIEYDQEKMTGLAVLFNKFLKTITIYNLSFDCRRENDSPNEPYKLQLQLQKIAILQVKQPKPNTLHSSTVNILQWNHNYKSEVDRLWDQTIASIKQFLKQEKEDKEHEKEKILQPRIEPTKEQRKEKLKLPRKPKKMEEEKLEPQNQSNQLSLDLKQLPALKIRKAQNLKRKLDYSQRQRTEPSPRPISTVGEQAQNMSKMFKKWSINQHIDREKEDAAQKAHEFRNTNRNIKYVLKSDQQKSERIEQLINVSERIKQVSRSPRQNHRYKTPVPSRIKQLENITKASEIAQSSTLKSYIRSKRDKSLSNNNIKTVPSEQEEHAQLERTNTMESRISDLQDIRTTNLSKVSAFSNVSKITGLKKTTVQASPATPEVDPQSLEARLTHKLESVLLSNQSRKERLNTYSYDSPNRYQIESRKDAIKERKESSKAEYDILRSRNRSSNTQKNLQSRLGSSFTVARFQTPSPNQSPEPRHQKGRFKTEETKGSQNEQTKKKKKMSSIQQHKHSEKVALQSMKKSELMLKDKLLPQIQSNKEKLAVKMKEKKSFIHVIKEEIGKTDLSVVKNGEQRKKLVSILSRYK